MSAVIRAWGHEFDVDGFLADSDLPVCGIKRRGEPVLPSEPDGRRHDRSGLNVAASDAGFDDFAAQIADAIAFLESHASELRRLVAYPGSEGASLDFGVRRRDVIVQCDHLPADLVRLAGSIGLGIELSYYPLRAPDAAEPTEKAAP